MTYRELSDMMDVMSNRFAIDKNTSLIPFDEYEKSFLLTKAANEIVKELMPFYDRNEKIKKQLLSITRVLEVNNPSDTSAVPNSDRYRPGTLVYEIPGDIMYVVSESLKDSSGAIIKRIKPLKDDEAYYTLESPFRAPTRTYAYRVGFSKYNNSTDQTTEYSEILTNVIAGGTGPVYHLKYLTTIPPFIVTEDLEDATIGGLSKLPDGISLDDEAPLMMLHEKILDRAVLLGYLSKSDDVNAKSASTNLSADS